MDLTTCLFQWIKTFNLKGNNDSLADLCDGVAIVHAMVQIAPEFFSASLISKIEPQCGSSWFLRVSNLRRIYLSIVDFYSEVLDRCIPDKLQPDLEAIARDSDLKQLGRLLQLLLGCAINCANKEKHIEVMTTLNLEVKHGLKLAIDELENLEDNATVDGGQQEASTHVERSEYGLHQTYSLEEYNKLKEELFALNQSKDISSQKCLDLEALVMKLEEEKQNLKRDNEKLAEKLANSTKGNSLNESTLRFDSIEHEALFQRLNNQISSLQNDLTRMEEQKEDMRINLDIKEKEYRKVLSQVEQLQDKLNEYKHDRDELDQMKYLNEEIIKYKNINDVQRKKLEEFQELRKQIKILEDRNSALVKQTCELEEEKKSLALYKSQVEMIKKQRDDLRTKATEESFRADKVEDELKRLYKKYTDTVNEMDKMKFELKKRDHEMTSSQLGTDSMQATSIDLDLSSTATITAAAAAVKHSVQTGPSLNLFDGKNQFGTDNTDINEKLIRLQFENDKLKKELRQSNDEKVKLLESQLEDERNRLVKMELENRTNHQRIIELEGQLKETKTSESLSNSNSVLTEGSVELRSRVKELELENSNLTSLVDKMTEELAEKEERFKKHVNKAKETFEYLETHINNSKISNSLPDTSKVQSEDIGYLRNLINQKDAMIEELRSEFERMNSFRDLEEQLMTFGFNNLSCQLQRKAAEDRIYSNNFNANPTFLSRQRQASSRKFIIPPRWNISSLFTSSPPKTASETMNDSQSKAHISLPIKTISPSDYRAESCQARNVSSQQHKFSSSSYCCCTPRSFLLVDS